MHSLDIILEIHAPGLNLHSSRWNFHALFLEEIEDHFEHVAAIAWSHYLKGGRGTLFIDDDQWMELIRRDWTNDGESLPSVYLSEDEELLEQMNFGPLGPGFLEMLKRYVPEEQVILSVRHRPGDMVSCYLFTSNPTPPECYEVVYATSDGSISGANPTV